MDGFVLRVTGPLMKVLAFYGIGILACVFILLGWPTAIDYVPLGGLEGLIKNASPNQLSLEKLNPPTAKEVVKTFSVLFLAMTGSCLAMIPVVGTYRLDFAGETIKNSIFSLLFIFPALICSLVFVVQHSLALAFSLAGIAAIVRFRVTVKKFKEVPYLVVGIAIGLSAGIGALGLSLVIGAIFCAITLVLWAKNS